MRDLALRGIQCLLVDKHDLCAGASGGNHGLLHSGARYVSGDLQSAVECQEEGKILKKIVPQCIEETGGLFVGIEGDDEEYAEKFSALCQNASITCKKIDSTEAHRMEPRLSPFLQNVFSVPDATVDPFGLALCHVAHATELTSSKYLPHLEVLSFAIQDGHIEKAICFDKKSGNQLSIHAHQIVNASGAWAMDIARLAGCNDVHLLWSKGTLLVSHTRLTNAVINRLRPPSDGDILVPGGTVSILGTTSLRTDDLENVIPTIDEININVREGEVMIPGIMNERFIRAFSRVRPLVLTGTDSDDRQVARSFSLFDHSATLSNFCTITGGKLTTFRLMAEKTSDLVAGRLGNKEVCRTRAIPIPDLKGSNWTEPGKSSHYWFQQDDPDDLILCECEMVPQSALRAIISESPGNEEGMSLESIALRSRIGKGSCQGSFCGIRVTSQLYQDGYYNDKEGLCHLRNFLTERFKGMKSVIWGPQMAQMELAEAMHCELLGLQELDPHE